MAWTCSSCGIHVNRGTSDLSMCVSDHQPKMWMALSEILEWLKISQQVADLKHSSHKCIFFSPALAAVLKKGHMIFFSTWNKTSSNPWQAVSELFSLSWLGFSLFWQVPPLFVFEIYAVHGEWWQMYLMLCYLGHIFFIVLRDLNKLFLNNQLK